MRHLLIDPQGNFGTVDDPPGAARYTECRLSKLSTHLLDGINENTVDFSDNYSGELQEPTVLPARYPNLLVNGSQGIAVGMATNIPPHNLREVIDAALHTIDNPDAPSEELLQFVKGPDFPTGGFLVGHHGNSRSVEHRSWVGEDPRGMRCSRSAQGTHSGDRH